MRIALRNNPQRRPPSKVTQIAAPIKGWTANGTPVDADPLTALVLENWFPEAQEISARSGSSNFASQVASDGVESLMAYRSGTSTKLFGCGDGKIINITSGGSFAGDAGDVSGLTGDRWYSVMMANAAGQHLICCNGEDSVRAYDGSAWSTPSLSGVTSSTLVYPHVHQRRLWFVQNGTTDLWYMDFVNSISGTLEKFGVGALLTKGGSVVSIGTWSADAGAGMDDFFVVMSSEGQIIVYQGTDPAVADLWTLMGVYDVGKPIGRRCMAKIGGDLALITEDGIVSAALARNLDRGVISAKSITANIRDAYNQAVRRSRDLYGWELIVHPIRNWLILNVPGNGATPTCQFVMNTTTGAWCKFTGWDARCWVNYDDGIYFGRTNGRVLQADVGAIDVNRRIELVALPAFNHLGMRGRLKHVKMVKPIYYSDIVDNPPSVSIAVDYETPDEGGISVAEPDGYFTWGVSTWGGPDVWFGGSIHQEWRGSGNIGTVVSPYTTAEIDNEGATNRYRYSLTGWTVVYEGGGIL